MPNAVLEVCTGRQLRAWPGTPLVRALPPRRCRSLSALKAPAHEPCAHRPVHAPCKTDRASSRRSSPARGQRPAAQEPNILRLDLAEAGIRGVECTHVARGRFTAPRRAGMAPRNGLQSVRPLAGTVAVEGQHESPSAFQPHHPRGQAGAPRGIKFPISNSSPREYRVQQQLSMA